MCPEEKLDERESYWIDYYNTYSGVGYNAAPGGEGASHPVKLSNRQVNDIIDILENSDITLTEIAKMFNVSRRTISTINCGSSRHIDGILYPIRPNVFSKDRIPQRDELLSCLHQSNYSFVTVANVYDVSRQCIITWCKRLGLPFRESDYKQLYAGSQAQKVLR